ncbi:site-specific DNA-methyltransferase [Erwinia pyrifoliae]|uniref:site-specific DNA-methyltransferase n=1 Tax=Erwinia pyrifoliae TaxID=79967 RepID=UPI00223A6AC7|nr:site-specific DNA-methyltransferase [Erwinia pyrifoliae]MCT2385121.1 site-specific DNA-methyltransferase [Erwinia pyrifoliae]
MKNTGYLSSCELINADSLVYIKTLPDNSIDLIATDPPYYRVKDCAWDRQWDTVTDYLAWLDEFLAEFWRVLKPNGSLYLFCGSKLAADTEILVRQRMQVLSAVTWAKPNGTWLRQNKASLRAFFPATERIIFAGHYGAEGFAKGQAGYASKCAALKGDVFAPLTDYFITARASLGVTAKEINEATGRQMCSHWFSRSQWQLPNREQYESLQRLFASIAKAKGLHSTLDNDYSGLTENYATLQQDYGLLRKQFDELRQQYEALRRPFSVTADVPYTDVWTFRPVASYAGKHPCEKPAELMEHIITSSSRPGDTVADFFMGSGATVKAALKLGRKAIGVELEEERFHQTKAEIG